MKSVNLHLPHVVKTKKFMLFRKALRCSAIEAAGLLGLVFGHALDLNPNGELSDWNEELLSELLGLEETRSNLVLETLVASGWLELRGERLFVNDWIEIAGPALIEKYRFTDKQRLINIWALHGQTYGPKGLKSATTDPDSESTVNSQSASDKPHSEFTVSSESAKKRGIPDPRASDTALRSSSSPVLKDGEEEKRFPSGIARGAVLEIHDSEAQAGEGERRDKKRRSEVNILSKQFYALLQEKFAGRSVDFNWPRAGKDFKEMLDNGLGVQEIAMRFPNYFASTDSWIVGQGFTVQEFRKRFTLLELGPITEQKSSANQDNTHGRKPFYDGEGNSPDYKYDDSIVHKY